VSEITIQQAIKHAHLFCGLGGGAKGFNKGKARVGNIVGKFECIGGIDVDAAAIRDFDRLSGSKGTVLDLFSLEQYMAFHGKAPPPGWREANPSDIQKAFGYQRPNIGFLSAPCKGFSGLLSESNSKTHKYQALNQLTLRGMWLFLEAYADDPVEFIIFENVPRIMQRGTHLLDQIFSLTRYFGYAGASTKHDCGELGGLAQSRKRYLGVFRHEEKVPPFLYEPPKRALRGVGEILDRMPLPGDERAGPMHRVPNLQWKTWVRLAFVEAGSDWRSLNKLNVENGMLTDFGIVPDKTWRDGTLGVLPYDAHAGAITAQAEATTGRFSVADPKAFSDREGYNGFLGVRTWDQAAATVTGNGRVGSGPHSVADPRFESGGYEGGQYGVRAWDETSGAIINVKSPGQGRFAVSDPRVGADGPRFNNVFRIVGYDQEARAVTGGGGAVGGLVADPRGAPDRHVGGKYRVVGYGEASNTVIAGSTTGNGAFAVADPRTTHGPNAHQNKMAVIGYDSHAKAITGSGRVGSGALSVADPRPAGLNGRDLDRQRPDHYGVVAWPDTTGAILGNAHPWDNGRWSVADPRPVGLIAKDRDTYANQGHYGVVGWEASAGAVPASCKNNNGSWSVADPREVEGEPAFALPAENERMVAVIRALDGTWHRPFTTMELAALQSLLDPEEAFTFGLDGVSDSAWRERIGNAVPADSAAAIASVMGKTLLMAQTGQSFLLSSEEIWVRPLAIALAVDTSSQP